MKKLGMIIFMMMAAVGAASAQYKVGDEVRDFSLKNVDGKSVSFRDFSSAKGFIVVFTCNHCPFSQAYEQRIIELDNQFKAKGYPVIAINPNDPVKSPDDSYDAMIVRSREKGYPFPYLLDESQSVAKQFGATRTPHVFIVKKDGKGYVLKYIGAIDNNTENPDQADKKYVADAVNSLIGGKNPETTETKAIGCTIKWK